MNGTSTAAANIALQLEHTGLSAFIAFIEKCAW